MRVDARQDDGFTLAELLVVILVLGILTAIAIPSFMSSRARAQDTSSISDITNTAKHVESCFILTGNYGNCNAVDATATGQMAQSVTGLTYGTALGQVAVYTIFNINGAYTIVSTSKSGRQFFLQHSVWGVVTRYCDIVGGLCRSDKTWG